MYDDPTSITTPLPAFSKTPGEPGKRKPSSTYDENKTHIPSRESALLTASQHQPTSWPSRAHFSLLPQPSNLRFGRAHVHVHAHAPATSCCRTILRDVLAPLRILLCYPIVQLASLATAFAANALLALNLAQAQLFGAGAYSLGFDDDDLGLVNLAFVLGAAAGLATAGPLSDWAALRGARRNGGVVEAEMRLAALFPFAGANVVGLVVAGVGYQRGWEWPVFMGAGYALIGLQVVGVPTVAVAYAGDCVSVFSLSLSLSYPWTCLKCGVGFGMLTKYHRTHSTRHYLARSW